MQNRKRCATASTSSTPASTASTSAVTTSTIAWSRKTVRRPVARTVRQSPLSRGRRDRDRRSWRQPSNGAVAQLQCEFPTAREQARRQRKVVSHFQRTTPAGLLSGIGIRRKRGVRRAAAASALKYAAIVPVRWQAAASHRLHSALVPVVQPVRCRHAGLPSAWNSKATAAALNCDAADIPHSSGRAATAALQRSALPQRSALSFRRWLACWRPNSLRQLRHVVVRRPIGFSCAFGGIRYACRPQRFTSACSRVSASVRRIVPVAAIRAAFAAHRRWWRRCACLFQCVPSRSRGA